MKDLLPHIGPVVENVLESLPFFVPELALAGLFLLVILNDLFLGKKYRNSTPALAFAGILLAGLLSLGQLDKAGPLLFGGMLRLDVLSVLMKGLFDLGSLFVIAFAVRDFKIRHNEKGWGDFFSMLIAALLGLHLMAMASNLLLMFLSIELVSICSYVLVGYVTRDRQPAESSMKYVLFGAVCSAIMLYGFSLLYGFTGSLNLDPLFGQGLAALGQTGQTLAILLSLAGFGFKLAIFPFHFWAPDVYQGSSNSVLAFLSTLPKAAGAAILLAFMQASPSFDWGSWLAIISIITMTIGNFQALWQDNVKRMLAYSSIGHSGFILMGLAAFSLTGEKAIFYYLLVYSLATIGAFMIVGLLAGILHSEEISAYKGMGRRMPIISVCFVILLMSLIGLPPVGGFVGKFFLFSAAYETYAAGGNSLFIWMLAAGALNTVVALYYYLKIPYQLFLKKSEGIVILAREHVLLKSMVVVLTVLTVLLGIFPESVLGHWE